MSEIEYREKNRAWRQSLEEKKRKEIRKGLFKKKPEGEMVKGLGVSEGWGTRLYSVREAKIGKSSKQFPDLLS